MVRRSRTPQGVRGLKPHCRHDDVIGGMSHSARSAWIETYCLVINIKFFGCRTPQGVRGLKLLRCYKFYSNLMSHSARSAWIETFASSLRR